VADARLRIALATGLVAGAVAIGVTLSQAPDVVAGVSTPMQRYIGSTAQATTVCQSGEVLPPAVSAIRLRVFAFLGPRVTLRVLARGRVIASGVRGSGWTGGVVTVPVKPLPTATAGATLCFTLHLNGDEHAEFGGAPQAGALAARAPGDVLHGRVRVEYMRPGGSSWWSLAGAVARRMDLGRGWPGGWSVPLVLVLMASVAILLCARLRRAPAAAWLCVAVACLNAASWSLITPPFEAPDEPEHVGYVKVLAEAGTLPTAGGSFSVEEEVALRDTHLKTVAEDPEYQPISSPAQNQMLQDDLASHRGPPEAGREHAGVAASQPPLYYALEAIPYTVAHGGTLLDRIAAMRLLSALMAGLTALFTFLFVRELLPGDPWAWTGGGVGVALVPLLGFTSGAVTPDSMLFAASGGTLYCLARGFRRGLARRGALVLGATIAIGLATKLNYVGLAPGALLGLIVLSRRAARTQGRAAYVSCALALMLALSPAAVYVVAHVASGAPALGIVSRVGSSTPGSPLAELGYIWQLYLPRLPGMHEDFGGIFTARQIWFDGYVGLYGWLDTTFPGWVYELALIPAALIAGLGLRGLSAGRAVLRGHVAELVVYGAMCVGLLALIGADSYSVFPKLDAEYGQARYLLPLLPLLGVALALAVRGAGRRWAPAVGVAIAMLFLAHDVFSQLQEVARFYG
jgi:hypothetical protein